jgi:hypothetical protein
LTGGFGYTFGKLTLDFAYQFENFRKRTSAHLFGINLGYRF